MADKPKIDFSRLEEYSRQSSSNARIAMVVQCQSCRKSLKYNGSKSIITCPSCGALVPTTAEIDWAALSSNATKKKVNKPQSKKKEQNAQELVLAAKIIASILIGLLCGLGAYFAFKGIVAALIAAPLAGGLLMGLFFAKEEHRQTITSAICACFI